jgi:hypothetical protein
MADEQISDADEATVRELQQKAEAAYLEARETVFDLTDGPFSVSALNETQRSVLIRLEAAQEALRDFQLARVRRRPPPGANRAVPDDTAETDDARRRPV